MMNVRAPVLALTLLAASVAHPRVAAAAHDYGPVEREHAVDSAMATMQRAHASFTSARLHADSVRVLRDAGNATESALAKACAQREEAQARLLAAQRALGRARLELAYAAATR
ncbi:MAG: hypothetical protein JO180_06125 [Gemmatirosa sp.]|nr:hypothetical protein [Gemmatirosa sp.]